jgi:Nif-specific regulatory protein
VFQSSWKIGSSVLSVSIECTPVSSPSRRICGCTRSSLRLTEELKDRFRPSNIIGNSNAMQEVYDLIAQVSKSDATVLIRGESGTGKELVAHAIHYNSLRAAKPFIKVNCAALPESVIESELFGHEKGAFTGAVSSRKGRFELADGGSLFLDEVGDVRLIAATNIDLERRIAEGRFRQDLYYRLDVFPIHLPPLRERKTDILLLADYFVEKYGKRNHKDVRRISTPAIDMLMAYHWPGNVRELENCIERAVLLSRDDVIHGHHLPPTLQTAEASGTAFNGRLASALENVEQELILDALKSARGNIAKAARRLGVSERIMGLRVHKYRIDSKRFRR